MLSTYFLIEQPYQSYRENQQTKIMPYIDKNQMQEKRKALKAAFPKCKFSITRRHHSSINVIVLEAPIDFLKTNDTVSEHKNQNDKRYIQVPLNKSTIKGIWTGEAQEALIKMHDILEDGNRTVDEHPDYGNVPQFYTHLTIGDWDKDFNVKI